MPNNEDNPIYAIAVKRGRLQKLLQDKIPALVVNGDIESRLAGNLHISIPGIPNSAIIARVRERLAISTGSACSSGVESPSHVLRAMNLPEDAITDSCVLVLANLPLIQRLTEELTFLSPQLAKFKKPLYQF